MYTKLQVLEVISTHFGVNSEKFRNFSDKGSDRTYSQRDIDVILGK